MEDDFMNQEWHLSDFNEGAEIRYIGKDGFSKSIPLEVDDVGHSSNIHLLKYIVDLHNDFINEGHKA